MAVFASLPALAALRAGSASPPANLLSVAVADDSTLPRTLSRRHGRAERRSTNAAGERSVFGPHKAQSYCSARQVRHE